MYWVAVLMVALAVASGAQAQLTAQSSVAPDLRECYTSANLVNRNNLPPATMPVVIDILRKIEDNRNVNVDMRQLAVLLLHTYRQDGIEFHAPGLSSVVGPNVLPFAPTFHSFHRHRLLLTRLIPANMQVLPNDTLSSELKCALHFMLSTTVDARVRGDENTCNQLSQYRALRTARSIDEDVEIMDPTLLNAARSGQLIQYDPNNDIEYAGVGNSQYEKQLMGESTCPLLGGVVNTPWGAVSAGNLIAGIAAGAQTQQVPLVELVKGSGLNYPTAQSTVTPIYPATLSGDLAEAVLIQGTDRGSTSISVGSTGGWNSTQATRHFLLQNRLDIEMTDPEIRGGLDGFMLGINFNSFSSVRLSQLLDMYYAPRNGVLNPALRACNRRILSETFITDTTLAGETFGFAAALDTYLPLRGTIVGGLDQLVNNAVSNLQSYITSNLNDRNCITTESTSHDFRLRTNLYLVLDASWPYQTVYPAISHLLDTIEVSKFGSSVTLLSAVDGSIVINTTFSIADFHTDYTLQRHQAMLNGVNLQNTLTNVRILMHEQLERERVLDYVGGNSTVLLFMLNTGNVQNNQLVWEQARILNETVPDLRIIFATSTNMHDALWNLVRDMQNDIITVALTSTGQDVESTMSHVVDRVSQVARRIINPLCGANFTAQGLSGSRHFDDFVEPGYINFYSISPNYFYEGHNTRRIRIVRATGGIGTLIVCHSRTVTQPRQNATILGLDENAITCQTLTTGEVQINLDNACGDFWFINACPPFFISVQSATGGQAATTTVCTDPACRLPYNLRFQVLTEDLACFSKASGVGAGLVFIVTAVALNIFRWL